MTVPTYATPGQKIWHYGLRLFCGFIFLFLVLPILVIIPLSFNQEPYFTYPMPGYSLRWYEEIFGDNPLSTLWKISIVNSTIVALSSAFLATTLGTLAALGLNQANFKFKNVIIVLLISPMIVPIVITAIGVFYFYSRIGLANSLLGIILAHTAIGVPFVVITVTSTLAGFDEDLVRAGSILGANPVRVFRKITLPIIMPGVASGGIFAFATSWDEVVIVLFMGSVEEHTIPRRMWSGIRENISPTIIAMATLLILLSIVLMLTMEWLRQRSDRLRSTESA